MDSWPRPIALAMAVMNSENDMTNDRIFFGALVKAYSSEVIDAKISEIARRIYDPELNPDVDCGCRTVVS